MARVSFGIANVMNRVGAHRWFMEKLLGIHRENYCLISVFRTFEKWAQKRA